MVTRRRGRARGIPGGLDLVRVGLLLAGLLAVATGLLPAAEARQSLARVAPLLLFLGSVIVLATLTMHARVFDAVAARLAIVARGDYVALFALVVVFASATTFLLNLDTTAVLLTPVLLALAVRSGIAALPLAMTTIWLANTASLLLPVSNLTNLLAADRVGSAPLDFAARMWLPQIAVVAATTAFLWACYWRRGRRGDGRYRPPAPVRMQTARERVLFRVSAGACVLFVVAIPVLRERIGYAAAGAALIVLVAFARLDPGRLRVGLVPWRLLVLVTGLFLVVPALARLGLDEVTAALVGTSSDAGGVFRAAAVGAGLSNVVNNLPAYVAVEAVVPTGNDEQLFGLLIGTNVGPLVTPWASLATLLCLESCRAHGLRVDVRRFALHGLGLAVVSVVVGVGALLLTA